MALVHDPTTDAPRVARPIIRLSRPVAPPTGHTAPLDTVIAALDATDCPWCEGLLRLLKEHLEAAMRGGWRGAR